MGASEVERVYLGDRLSVHHYDTSVCIDHGTDFVPPSNLSRGCVYDLYHGDREACPYMILHSHGDSNSLSVRIHQLQDCQTIASNLSFMLHVHSPHRL